MGPPELLLILFCLSGLIGTFIPLIPATPLIAAGGILYGVTTGFAVLPLRFVVSIALLSLAAESAEYVLGAAGARKFGASRRGMIGAALGLLPGLILLGPLGLLVGPMAGALAGELLDGKDLPQALRSTLGALAGSISGRMLKILIALLMVFLIILRFI